MFIFAFNSYAVTRYLPPGPKDQTALFQSDGVRIYDNERAALPIDLREGQFGFHRGHRRGACHSRARICLGQAVAPACPGPIQGLGTDPAKFC